VNIAKEKQADSDNVEIIYSMRQMTSL